MAPVQECWHSQAPQLTLPRPDEIRIGCAEAKVDARVAPSGSGDRSVSVRDQLRNDLREVDPSLGEILAKVPAAHAAMAQTRRIDGRCHSRSIKPMGTSARPSGL
jgi:hypothetical protein